MISRRAANLIVRLSKMFPIVSITGPRQCGKTTLAKDVVAGQYFDLELPSDYQVFAGDPELALRRFPGPIVLDEAQTLPGLFPVLRSLVDQDRRACGRYFLLGSVDPLLMEDVSESLAGRVGIVELTPFLFAEVADHLRDGLALLWLRGGYPDALLAADEMSWQLWQDNYIRTLIERDIVRRGIRLSPVEMRRLLGMIAGIHGGILNLSELGRSMGVSYHSIHNYLDVLEAHFLIRRLPPYYANIGKRLVKAPKVYLRDSGVLHFVLGITSERGLLESPRRGASWEGFLVEQIIALERLASPASQYFFFRTHAGAEIDLVIERGGRRIGYEFKCAMSVAPRDWANLTAAIAEGVVHEGYVVYLGPHEFPAAEGIVVIPAATLLSRPSRALATD